MKNIVIIAGPTASGKTAAAVELARRINGEVVSADSMQIYKFMNIGSAKPTAEEMCGIPHYMIDIIYPFQDFSVALYRQLAGEVIDDIISRGKVPIVAGGTGLYINSLTYPMDFTQTSEDKDYRNYLCQLGDEKGNEYLHSLLKDIDPESYERLFPNDRKRVIRALEVYKHTGKTISQYQAESKNKPIEYNIAYIGLTMDRQRLYDRINLRVDKMFQQGLVDEVKFLYKMGYNVNMTSMQAIGYKELLDYFNNLCTLQEAKENIKQGSRRYAKRQLTWFRRDERIHWVEIDKYNSLDEIMENILEYIKGMNFDCCY